MKKLTKTQKIVTLVAVAVAIVFLMLGCAGAASNEVKTDSTITDTTLVDSVKVDTLK